ncbi:MAG: GNAT family N-acetyltransferase [Planctomycetaceae bacterium]|nr:GNAT family N-acetyltransferase [Planctomycetaceae bacterium]
MFEIRPYEGSPEELAKFVTPIWVRAYAESMCVPLWTPEFLTWALDWSQRDHLVTAWDGTRLIGCLLANVYEMHYLGELVKGTQCSYLTVDPEYRRRGIANLMVEQQRKVNVEQQIAFELGYLYTGNQRSMGPKFWRKRQSMNQVTSAGFWVRNLDHRAVADWTPSGLDRVGAKLLSLFQRSPRRSTKDRIRDFQTSDLASCRELINEVTQRSELGILWEDDNLLRQLQSPEIVRTLVWEEQQQIRGFINYCRLEFQANGVITVGLIDVVSLQRLASQEQVEMLEHTLSEMAEEGIELVMLLRPGPAKSLSLIRSGFVPRLKDFILQLQPTSKEFTVKKTTALNILWR